MRALALAALLALTGCGGAPKPLPAVTVTATPTAPRPVTFAQGSPEYQQLQACLFTAGYTGNYTSTGVPVIHFTAKGRLPEINFRVDTAATPRTITPEAGRDAVLLRTAGCL